MLRAASLRTIVISARLGLAGTAPSGIRRAAVSPRVTANSAVLDVRPPIAKPATPAEMRVQLVEDVDPASTGSPACGCIPWDLNAIEPCLGAGCLGAGAMGKVMGKGARQRRVTVGRDHAMTEKPQARVDDLGLSRGAALGN